MLDILKRMLDKMIQIQKIADDEKDEWLTYEMKDLIEMCELEIKEFERKTNDSH